MAVIINETFLKKATELKKPLQKSIVKPIKTVEIIKNEKCFQHLEVKAKDCTRFPLTLKAGDSVILDFGDHFVGYLDFSLDHFPEIKITDTPVRFKFTFGEFPLEIVTPPEEYKGGLGCGWLQNEERSYVFLPCDGHLERRYSFRYLKIERTDSASFPVKFTDIFCNAVSAVSIGTVPEINIKNDRLKKIYDISLKTLKECEQDVFEDGPKRDRRLWIGDLRLQALTDYKTFGNTDLIKRCIYLFAACTGEHKMVAPCIFPDSPPYVDEWTFADYSLFFISCLYDYMNNTNDMKFVEELYEIAVTQADAVFSYFDKDSGKSSLRPFVDWCPELDKSVAFCGAFIYTMKQLKEIQKKLNVNTDKTDEYISVMTKILLIYYDKEKKLFYTADGQLSVHSQVWAVLSDIFTESENRLILRNIESIDTKYTMRTPYMRHFYIEALCNNGLKEEALQFITSFWGLILDAGFDCCPEIFNPGNEFESPYNAPEINSACHAWSCTPAYWIPLLIK